MTIRKKLLLIIGFFVLFISVYSVNAATKDITLIDTTSITGSLYTPNGLFALSPEGIATNETNSVNPKSFYIIDSYNNGIWEVNSSFHNITPKHDTLSEAGSSSPLYLDYHNSDFYFYDTSDDFVYHFNSSFKNQTGGFPRGSIDGLASNSSNIFFPTCSKILTYDLSGVNVYNITIDGGWSCSLVQDMKLYNNEDFYMLYFVGGYSTGYIAKIRTNGTYYGDRYNVSSLGAVSSSDLNSFAMSSSNDAWIIGYHTTGGDVFHIQLEELSPPNITIITPLNEIYGTSSMTFNVTAIDGSGVSTCEYSLDNGETKTAMSNPGGNFWNATNSTMTQGIHTVDFYCNDTLGNMNNSEEVTFAIDSVYPHINLTYPLNTTYKVSNLSLNYTFTDSSPSSCWYNNGSTNSSTQTCGTNWTNIIVPDGSHTWIVYVNDSANNVNSSNITFFKDTIYPLIDYDTETSADYSNLSQNFTYVNVTITETNFQNITFTLKNDTGTVNSTTYTSLTYEINWTNLDDNNYTYFVNITDIANNQNSTSIRYITLDTTNPNATLLNPANETYNNTDNNYTVNVTDNLGIKNATLYIQNDSGTQNTTTTAFAKDVTQRVIGTVVNLADGVYEWFYSIFDWAGNLFTSEVRTVTIDTVNPKIGYDSTTTADGIYKQAGNIFINVTTNDTNLDSVMFDWNGVNESFDNSGNGHFWENQTGLGEGTYTFYSWANDSANNKNYTSLRTVYIDLNNPALNIVHPTASSYNYNTSISLNFTVSDTNLDSCWYNLDNSANVSLPSCNNITFDTSEDAHTLYLYANDSSGRESSDTVTFTVSLAAPQVIINFPLDDGWLDYKTNIGFNFTPNDTTLDTCRFYGNWTPGGWHLNQSNSTPVSNIINTFTASLEEGAYIWNVLCNDSGNNQAWGNPSQNNTVNIDTTFPLITFGTGTSADELNTTNTFIYVDIDVTELNEDTVTFDLYYSNGTSANSTSFTDSTRNINWTGLPDAVYNYNVTINDSAGNTNFTETRIIRLDNTAPNISILIPVASQNYANNNSMTLNYSVADNVVGLDECWYNVFNSSGSLIISTTTLSTCQNTTFALPGGDIDYDLNLFAKDILSNTQSSSVTFGIRTESPAVQLTTVNDTQTNTTTDNYFNFTVTTNADSIANCSLYGNWTPGGWHLNETLTSITQSTDTNFSSKTISEGEYFWNVLCYDNFATGGWALNNNTFVVDLTFPFVNITSISTSTGSQTISFVHNISDTNLDTCRYSIYNSLGLIDGVNEDRDFICGSNPTGATVTAFGTYNLTIYGLDKANNENSSIKSFTTSPSSSGPGGGGGSATTEPDDEEEESFCGDGICQEDGNDKGLVESYWSCNIDCPGKIGENFDELIYSLLKYCFDKDPTTPCWWKEGFGSENGTSICGDGVCERNENTFSCNTDCGDLNFNTLVLDCGDNNKNTPCFWNTNLGFYAIFLLVCSVLFLMFIELDTKQGKVTTYRYIVLKYKKKRRRRR